MREALTKAGFFDDPTPHKLLILGDLFDRGLESREMQAFICSLMDKDEVILIRGNHEDLFKAFATVDMGNPYSHHISNGTYNTALHLTGMDKNLALGSPHSIALAAMTTPYFRVIMSAMLDYYETSNYIFVHGWIPCFKEHHGFNAISDWRNASPELWAKARWINGMAAYESVYDDKTIVCGHWHASYGHSKIEGNGPEFGTGADFTPFYGNGIIALDACTAVSGFVNCIVIED